MNFRTDLKETNLGFQMAPMVDVVFLLLIFFMVATVYAQWETKIGLTVPTADSGIQASRNPGEIIINLDEGGKIYINSVEVSIERLHNLLSEIAETFTGQPVIIRADKKTNFESVIEVLDLCRKVDIWNVSFATVPKSSEN